MATHPINLVFPHAGTASADAARQALANMFPLVLESAAEIQSINFTQANAVGVPIEVRLNGTAFIYDAADSSTAHDGVSCLVSQDNKRYKSSVQPSYFTNVLSIENTPPVSPAIGDRILIGTAPTGDYVGHGEKLTVYISTGWVKVSPAIGQRVYVREEEVDYQYGEAGNWTAAGAVAAEGVGAQELAFPWGMVVESETATPPSTRFIGATPTMPLGGTAANINDDTAGTTGVTSALGNLAAAAVADRIIAKLDLLADTALLGLEAKQFRASTGSSSASAMGFYYATAAAPTTWIQLGAGFTLTASLTDFSRSSAFTARYVAVVTEAKDWSTATQTLGDFNAYKAATGAADGTKYIVAANGIAAFSGHDGDVAEAWGGAYRFYDPYEGASLYDRNLSIKRVFRDGVWESEISGYSELIEGVNNNEADFALTSASVAASYLLHESTAPTTSLPRFVETLTVEVEADYAGQEVEIEYVASVRVENWSFTMSAVATIIAFTGGVLVDGEANARDWQQIDRFTQASSSTVDPVGLERIPRLNMKFVLTLADTDPHTIKVAVWPYENGAGEFTAGNIRFLRRRLLARKRS